MQCSLAVRPVVLGLDGNTIPDSHVARSFRAVNFAARRRIDLHFFGYLFSSLTNFENSYCAARFPSPFSWTRLGLGKECSALPLSCGHCEEHSFAGLPRAEWRRKAGAGWAHDIKCRSALERWSRERARTPLEGGAERMPNRKDAAKESGVTLPRRFLEVLFSPYRSWMRSNAQPRAAAVALTGQWSATTNADTEPRS